MRGFIAIAAAVLGAVWLHERSVKEHVANARRETRRDLIDHLRQNARGLIMLDQAVLSKSEILGPVVVLGDDTMIVENRFIPNELV